MKLFTKSFNSSQRWRLKKLLIEVVMSEYKGFAVNYEETIDMIEEITLNPGTVPACPMLARCDVEHSACHMVLIGREECGDCYADVVESLKPLEKVSSKKEEVV